MLPLNGDSETPDRAVLMKPITWHFPRLRAVAHERRAPYPRTWTAITRSTFTGAEIASAVVIHNYQNSMQHTPVELGGKLALAGVGNPFPLACSFSVLTIPQVSTAAAVDGLIALAAILGVYDDVGAAFGAVLDVIPIVICIVGISNISQYTGVGQATNTMVFALCLT